MVGNDLRRLWHASLKHPPAFPGAMEAWRNAVVGYGPLDGFHGRLDAVNEKSGKAQEMELEEALDLVAEKAIGRGRNKGPGILEDH